MDITRPAFTSLATAALTGAGLYATRHVRAWHERRTAGDPNRPTVRIATGGCQPDGEPYISGLVPLDDLDATHQGIAIAMLRDRFDPTEPDQKDHAETSAAQHALAALDADLTVGDDPVEDAVNLDYGDALRSCTELTMRLAMHLADDEIVNCTCEEDHSDAAASVLNYLAGAQMAKFATVYEANARKHATQCRACAACGSEAPMLLRARYARAISDDFLTNFWSPSMAMPGVPLAAAMDVIEAMVLARQGNSGISVDEQISELSRNVCVALAEESSTHGG